VHSLEFVGHFVDLTDFVHLELVFLHEFAEFLLHLLGLLGAGGVDVAVFEHFVHVHVVVVGFEVFVEFMWVSLARNDVVEFGHDGLAVVVVLL